jgi:hypothetical protein
MDAGVPWMLPPWSIQYGGNFPWGFIFVLFVVQKNNTRDLYCSNLLLQETMKICTVEGHSKLNTFSQAELTQ